MNETKKSHGQEEHDIKNMAIGFVGDMMNESQEIDESKNKPTNPKLWAASLAWAKRRYKVCPSAYCNGAAAKHYKSKGGGWRKSTNESLQEEKKSEKSDVYHKSYTSAINSALDYAEKRGYEYDKEETATKIGSGPKKPADGKTNRFTISLYKDGKEQKNHYIYRSMVWVKNMN
jgi:cation transport regulator ChaB